MRIPQVTDRMKEAPTQAMRALFSGIGQLFLAAEKARNRDGEPGGTGPADADLTAQDRTAASATDPYGARWRSLDKTGNVRILSPDELESDASGAGEAHTRPSVQPGPDRPREHAAQREPTPPGPAAPAALAGLPVPNYDGLSLASVRARLRVLDRTQLTALLDYEQANAGRADFLTMFERRIAKLDAGRA